MMTGRRPRSSPRRVGVAASVVASVVVVGAVIATAGCDQARVDTDDDLCHVYSGLDDSVEELVSVDPDTVQVDDLRARAEDVQEQLDAVQAVAEGRLDSAISTMRTTVSDLADAAVDAGQEAVATARPLIEDTLDDLDEAWARVQQLVDPLCGEA